MKIRYLFLIALIFLDLGCKKYLADYISAPGSTHFPRPEDDDYENVRIEVNPEIAPDGMVFGGLGKRFKFKNEWYVLADYMYKYDEARKTLTKTASNLVLRIDNEKTITIYGKNLPYIPNRQVKINKDNHDDYMNNAWYNLKINELTIDYDEIYHEWNYLNYYEYKVNYSKGEASGKIYGIKIDKLNAEWPSSLTLRQSARGKTYTKDLLNWTTKTNYKVYSTPVYFPSPSLNINSKNPKNFNASTGLKGERIVYFKGYLYALGGYTEISPDGLNAGDKKTVNITGTVYHRIALGKDISNPDNWEVLNAPEKVRRAWPWMRIDKDKLYINDGFRVYADLDLGVLTANEDKYKQHYDHDFIGNIYSTRDGINWSHDTEQNYKNSSYIGYNEEFATQVGPPASPLIEKINPSVTPLEYNYAELNGKQYIIKPAKMEIPEDKIRKLAQKEETNYTLSEDDIKNIMIQRLYVYDKDKSASLPILNPLPTSLLWLGGSQYIFNFNNKIVRLVDYANAGNISVNFESESRQMKEAVKYWEDTIKDVEKGLSGYSKKDACYYYLYAKMWYDAYMYYNTNSIYFMPSKAITHYSIDFRY